MAPQITELKICNEEAGALTEGARHTHTDANMHACTNKVLAKVDIKETLKVHKY